MTTIFPPDPCAPAIHMPPPTAKTVREVRLEQLLIECLPYVLVSQQTDKTAALVERVNQETA